MANNGSNTRKLPKMEYLFSTIVFKEGKKSEEIDNHVAVVSSSATPLPSMPEGLPDPSLAKAPLFVGKYDYSPRTDDDLSVKK